MIPEEICSLEKILGLTRQSLLGHCLAMAAVIVQNKQSLLLF